MISVEKKTEKEEQRQRHGFWKEPRGRKYCVQTAARKRKTCWFHTTQEMTLLTHRTPSSRSN